MSFFDVFFVQEFIIRNQSRSRFDSHYNITNSGPGERGDAMNAEDANKLYVGLLIMLIFSEALAL